MQFLRKVRPSNLIILSALPFIVYLFAASTDYRRSLAAILGIEHGSGVLVPGFILLLCAFVSGLAVLFPNNLRPMIVRLAAGVNIATAALLAFTTIALPFVASVVANSVDPFVSDLVVRGETPRRLTDAALTATAGISHTVFLA
jgi:polar amino acid transport system permease protein